MARILLVEDANDIVALVETNLDDLGFSVELDVANDGADGFEKASEQSYALLILDIDLPLLDGVSICRQLRARGNTTPVLMLTGRDTLAQRVEGLESGADDYLCKPFSTHELFARIRAILRRNHFDPLGLDSQASQEHEQRLFGQLCIDPNTREVWLADRPISLSKNEFDTLLLLSGQPGRVFSRSELLYQIFGYENASYESNVNTLITRLRHKMEPNPAKPQYILTQWGAGYRFARREELEL